jgi:hypothetical protein
MSVACPIVNEPILAPGWALAVTSAIRGKNRLGSSGLGGASELADGCVMVFASVCPAGLAIVNVLVDDELRSYNGRVRTLLVS